PKTAEFEEKFADYIGVKYAVALNSCTAALHLALLVAGVEKKEVITTPMTFVSTNHAILYNNATPVFCDIYEDTLNINVEEIESLITSKTRAITVVHYGGHACHMDTVLKIARKHSLKIIEDCAHACGGEYQGGKLGSIGDMGCFSFHAVKNLATGEGGMITTNDAKAYERLKKLRWLGISKGTWQREREHKKYDWQYNVEETGFKCHMHDISAVIGIEQLKKLEKLNTKRRRIVDLYNRQFSKLHGITLPVERKYAKSARHNYVVKLGERDALNLYLQEKGISTGVHYYPNHLYGVYRRFCRKLPVAESVWKRILTLPLYPDMKKNEMKAVVKAVTDFTENKGKTK
ncbi:MAG: DegT/DnrJ/EryC1/StrS family aminotransferase, partial [Candidatus Omnitrophica bacterium]|nr:DegT/DnrJ/EryC1/StrS family aminotransferase [Candidatus Omnitrophota bacterium]